MFIYTIGGGPFRCVDLFVPLWTACLQVRAPSQVSLTCLGWRGVSWRFEQPCWQHVALQLLLCRSSITMTCQTTLGTKRLIILRWESIVSCRIWLLEVKPVCMLQESELSADLMISLVVTTVRWGFCMHKSFCMEKKHSKSIFWKLQYYVLNFGPQKCTRLNRLYHFSNNLGKHAPGLLSLPS